MLRPSRAFAVVSLVAFCAACDKSGIHPLGRPRDNLGPCTSDTETWLRTTDTSTEVFLVGAPSTGPDGLPAPRCFARAVMAHDTTTWLEYGTFTEDGTSGSGTFAYAATYEFIYEPDVSLLNRRGSEREDLDPPMTRPVAMVADGEELLLTYASETRRLTALPDLIDRLDVTTQDGAEDVFRVFYLPLLTSQVRVPGFGGTGMTQYLNQTSTFAGTIENFLTVNVENILNPDTDIEYVAFVDLTGIRHDGLIHSVVDLSGNGTMEGVVEVELEGRTRVLRGSVDYADVLIRRGVAGDGTYAFTLESGGTYTLSYMLASDIDLRGILPVSVP